jgi:chemotaxis protein MotB
LSEGLRNLKDQQAIDFMQRKIFTRSPQSSANISPRWLTTFNDMATLLMVFFVLLFSLGSVDAQRYKDFRNALQSAMGVLYEGQRVPVGLIDENDLSKMQAPGKEHASSDDRNLQDAESTSADTSLDSLNQGQGLEAEYTPKGIKLSLDDSILFDSGEASLKEAGSQLLDRVAAIIKPLGTSIRVEGHCDDVPINNLHYPSNWELSMARSIKVVKFFIEKGDIEPQRLSAVGYADSKPRVPNNSDANRSRNRRVEIILEKVNSLPMDQKNNERQSTTHN